MATDCMSLEGNSNIGSYDTLSILKYYKIDTYRTLVARSSHSKKKRKKKKRKECDSVFFFFFL